MSLVPLSAVMIAQNEEGRIARSMERLRWVDEILVVDGGSQDRTIEIGRKLGATVLVHPWKGFSKQRTFAISQAKHDWILMVDADEVVTPELEREIRDILQKTPEVMGYQIRRRAFFLDREVRHSGWSPDYQLRFFDRRCVEVEDLLVHEGVRIGGPSGKLLSCIEHHTVLSLEDYLARMNRYTTLEAKQRFAHNAKQVSLLKLIGSPLGEFPKVYWTRGGFLDGWRGLLISAYSALYRFLLYAKLWHLQNSLPKIPSQ